MSIGNFDIFRSGRKKAVIPKDHGLFYVIMLLLQQIRSYAFSGRDSMV